MASFSIVSYFFQNKKVKNEKSSVTFFIQKQKVMIALVLR